MSYKRSDLQFKIRGYICPALSDAAYPRFKINPLAKELNELYTPTVYELALLIAVPREITLAYKAEGSRDEDWRSTLFLFLESTSLVSTARKTASLPDAIAFLLAHKGLHT